MALRLAGAVALVLALSAASAFPQTIQQAGPWTQGHAPSYSGGGSSSPFVTDGGPAGGGAANPLLEMGLVNPPFPNGNPPPYEGTGTGVLGSNWCDYDGPLSSAAGYHFLCISPNSSNGTGLIDYGAVGAAAQPLYFVINGISYNIAQSLPAFIANSVLVTNGTQTQWATTLPSGLTIPAANLGTPTAIDLANATFCAISTCVSGMGSGVATALGTATNASGGFPTIPVGVTQGGTGQTTFTVNGPLLGNGTSALAQGTRSGTTTVFGTTSGALTNGDCVSINSGNLVDAGGACTVGGGGGTVSAGTTGQIGVYPSNGTTIAGVTAGAAGSVLAQMANVIYVANYVGTSGCKGNDAVDDSVAINNAITAAVAAGGGVVQFSNGMDCRLKNPILLQASVVLQGAGPIGVVGTGTTIRAGGNLSSLITQSSMATFIHSAGIRGLTLDGRVGTYTVSTALVDVWWVNGRLENNYIVNGSAECVFFKGALNGVSPPDWINFIRGNTIGPCATFNLDFQGSNSNIEDNYFTGGSSVSQYDAIFDQTGGNIISGNTFENATAAGVVLQGQGTGCASNFQANVVTGNVFTLDALGIWVQLGPCGGTLAFDDVISSNVFFSNTNEDIAIDGGINNGLISANNFNGSTPASGNIAFTGTGPGSGNTGWTVGPNIHPSGTLAINAPPADLTIVGKNMRMAPVNIAGLGTCNSAAQGTLKYVVDGTGAGTPAFHANVVGGGSTPVFSIVSCNGTTWQYE